MAGGDSDDQRGRHDQAVLDEAARQPSGVMGSSGRMLSLSGPALLPLRGIRSAFRALSYRDYCLLWLGSLLSNIGTWVAGVAKSWLVFDLTQSEWWLGVDAMALWIPTVLLLPLGGVLADRLNRRWVLAGGNVLLALLSLGIAGLHALDALRVGHLIAFSAGLGVIQAILIPCNQSLLPMLVGQRDLPNAVALNAMQFNISRAIGPAIGGEALVRLGAGWSFTLNAGSFVALIVPLLLLRVKQATATTVVGASAGLHDSFVKAMAYLRSRPDLIVIEAAVFIGALASAPILTMLPPFVKEAAGSTTYLPAMYQTSEKQFALLLSAFGVGAVIGTALLAARSHRAQRPWRAFPTLLLFSACQIVLGFRDLPWVLVVLVTLLSGMTFLASLNRLFAALLSSTPDDLRGRMSSIHVLCFSVGVPLGSMAAGAAAQLVTIHQIFTVAGMIALLAVALLAWVTQRYDVRFQPRSDDLVHE